MVLQAFISARLSLSSIHVAIAKNCVLVCLLAFSQRSPLNWYRGHQSQAGWRELQCVVSCHVAQFAIF